MNRKFLALAAVLAATTAAACAPPPPPARITPKPACVAVVFTIREGTTPWCDVQPPTRLNVTMDLTGSNGDPNSPFVQLAVDRCSHMGGEPIYHPGTSQDPYGHTLVCEGIDY